MESQIVNGINYRFVIKFAFTPSVILKYSVTVYSTLNGELSITDSQFVDLPSFNPQLLKRDTYIQSIPFINEVEALVEASLPERLQKYQFLAEVYTQLPYYVLYYSNQQGSNIRIIVSFDPIAYKIETIQIEELGSQRPDVTNINVGTREPIVEIRPDLSFEFNQLPRQTLPRVDTSQFTSQGLRSDLDINFQRPTPQPLQRVSLNQVPSVVRSEININADKLQRQEIPRVNTYELTSQNLQISPSLTQNGLNIGFKREQQQVLPRVDTSQIISNIAKPTLDVTGLNTLSSIGQAPQRLPRFDFSLNHDALLSQLQSRWNPALIPFATESFSEELDPQTTTIILQYIARRTGIQEDFTVLLVNRIRYGLRVVIKGKNTGALYEAFVTYTYANGNKHNSEVELLSWRQISSIDSVDPDVFSKYYPIDSQYITPQLDELIRRAFKNEDTLSRFQRIAQVEKKAAFDGIYYHILLDTLNTNRYQVGLFWIPENDYLEILKYELVSSGYDPSR